MGTSSDSRAPSTCYTYQLTQPAASCGNNLTDLVLVLGACSADAYRVGELDGVVVGVDVDTAIITSADADDNDDIAGVVVTLKHAQSAFTLCVPDGVMNAHYATSNVVRLGDRVCGGDAGNDGLPCFARARVDSASLSTTGSGSTRPTRSMCS